MSASAATAGSTTPRPDTALHALLRPLLPAAAKVAVAYSGGLDSTVLLHAAVQVAAGSGAELHALHVHHGLSPQADAWLCHAQACCGAWGVAFHAAHVAVTGTTGEGVEAEARRLRYDALTRLARHAGCARVLLAHHADDQAETVLLQALRGGGLAGLAGMPAAVQRHGVEWVRPWLSVPRAELVVYQQSAGLPHVNDDSNADPRYARNRLRHGPLAVLNAGFPGAAEALRQLAADAQEALEVLRERAEADLAEVQCADGLDVPRWSQLSRARRSGVVRLWLARCLARTPPRSLVERLLLQVAPGAPPRRWPAPGGRFVACYREVLTCAPGPALALPAAPPGAGDVELVEGAVSGIPRARLVALSWRPRSGGEQFQLHPGGVPRSLKKCFQAAGVPAWQRGAPLLYAGDTLLFVPALGADARYLQAEGDDLVSLRWVPRQAG